jgi:A/G-specific adenine glycosylase
MPRTRTRSRSHTSDLTKPLLRWFAAHKRDLPWRAEPRDSYHVWLSEVMLQQTQVATVIPYYQRWLARFPTLEDFAAAPLDDVLKLWEGLGYYSRARNFHKAAQIVVNEMGGDVPRDVAGLMALPGVGRYTAGAIASLAFNQHAPLLDGNVKRVLSRVFGLATPSDEELWLLAESLLPRGKAGAFNEALMELGATVCTPRSPACPSCPICKACTAYANGDPLAYPAKVTKKATPHVDVTTAVIVDGDGRVLMGQRPRDGLLGGLWEFISSEFRVHSAETLDEMVARRTGLTIDANAALLLGTVKHAFTHFKIARRVWLVETRPSTLRQAQGSGGASLQPDGYDQLRWVPLDEVRQLALTRSDQKLLDLYEAHQVSLFAQAG